jgi:hypothetical protein
VRRGLDARFERTEGRTMIAIVQTGTRFVAVNAAGGRFSTPVDGGGRYEGEDAQAVGRYARVHSPGVRSFASREACVSAMLKSGDVEENEILPGVY